MDTTTKSTPSVPDTQANDGVFSLFEDAISPEGLPEYMRDRPSRFSGLTREECEADPEKRRESLDHYLDRHRSRHYEALTPGKNHPVKTLAFIYQTHERLSVYDRKTGQRKTVRKCKWHLDAYKQTPAAIQEIDGRFINPAQKCILELLYSLADRYTFHAQGRFEVRDITYSYLAHRLGYSIGHTCDLVHDLEDKGFLKIRQRGACQSNVYYLARYENGGWVYPAGSPGSGRGRFQRATGQSLREVNWQAARTQRFRRKPRKSREVKESTKQPPTSRSQETDEAGYRKPAPPSERGTPENGGLFFGLIPEEIRKKLVGEPPG